MTLFSTPRTTTQLFPQYTILSVQGIVRALTEYQHKLLESNVSIFVRRGGPNYQEGLRAMRETGIKLGLKMYVFGPETHMTAIVGMALGMRPIPKLGQLEPSVSTASLLGVKSVSNSIVCLHKH